MATNPIEYTFRAEELTDATQVRAVLTAAFPTAGEANLVTALWENGGVSAAYVAEADEQIVGHILYSPMSVDSSPEGSSFIGLAPLAVHPDWQNKGVGTALTNYSLEQLKSAELSAIFVLGHPHFYARFGFETAGLFEVRCEFEVPEEAFMVLELKDGTLEECSGVASYRAEFRELG